MGILGQALAAKSSVEPEDGVEVAGADGLGLLSGDNITNCIPVFIQRFADVEHLIGEDDFHRVICVFCVLHKFRLSG